MRTQQSCKMSNVLDGVSYQTPDKNANFDLFNNFYMNLSVRSVTFYNKSVIRNGNDDGDDGDVVDDLEAVIMISHVFDPTDDAASLTHLINITRMMIIMSILHIDDEGDNPEDEDDENDENHEDNADKQPHTMCCSSHDHLAYLHDSYDGEDDDAAMLRLS